MITQKEIDKNIENRKIPAFPTGYEIIEYSESGKDDLNALEYEKAYHALIEQVIDKTHDEKVAYLMQHMDELRDIVELFSTARDMYMFDDDDISNEILANILIYRYENKISILDDMYCEATEDYLHEIEYQINERECKKYEEEMALFEKEHPEEYKKQQEEFIRECALRIQELIDEEKNNAMSSKPKD